MLAAAGDGMTVEGSSPNAPADRSGPSSSPGYNTPCMTQGGSTPYSHLALIPSREAGQQLEPGDEEAEAQVEEAQRKPGPRDAQTNGQLRGQPESLRLHAVLRHLAIVGLLINASIWGSLAREGLIALNTYAGQSIQPVIWAQAVGCLVMGWTVANKADLEAIYPPLFVAFGTGFCGSLTTFSTWILEVFQAYSNQLHYDRHGLHNVMDALTQTGATLGMSLVSLAAGKALGQALPVSHILALLSSSSKALGRKGKRTGDADSTGYDGGSHEMINRRDRSDRNLNFGKAATDRQTALNPLFIDSFCFIVLGLGFWVGAALLAGLSPSPSFRPTTFVIVFAPPGTLLRWYLSRWNSSRLSKSMPYWPLGTFTANILATAILAALFVAQHIGPATSPGRTGAHTVIACQVIKGLQDGLCGCLSTISTFAVELTNLRPHRRAVGYAIGSYVVGITACVLIIGIPWWSREDGMSGSCALL